MSLVTVDFDGTLYQGNSFKVMFEVGKKTFTKKQWGILAIGLMKSIAIRAIRGKLAFKHEFFKSFARTFRGQTTDELNLFFKELVEIGKKDVHRDLVQRIINHQKNGDTIIVLSGALHPFLRAFTKELELDIHVISTELLFDDNGHCTGEVGTIINGQEKVLKVKQWIEKEDTLFTDTWAYADSESDIPLLEFVNNPIVVNPNEEMSQIASKNNWPIFESQMKQA